ncbi:MAG: PhoH family protein [Hyphomonadaceae bacterium]|jgi:phosphate starvation-inducible PhoH-like protein|nr:PhoH family protein [Hyphomonadaceae bacterium]
MTGTGIVSFETASNDALAQIAGPAHRNLALLEHAFAVQAHASGGVIEISGGDQPGREMALSALAWLAERILAGAVASEPEMRAAIRFAKAGGDGADQSDSVRVPGRRAPVTARTPRQARYLTALRNPANDLVFGVGPAGTGKTFLAVAVAVADLLAGRIARIIITRPAVEAGERLGFLPGDLEEKIDPYLQPVWDALRQFLGNAQFERRKAAGEIEIAPLAFMRGRTLSDAFVIVDEAQNATRMQMKMLLTRLGEGSRMAVNGDPSQIDLPRASDSGLAHALGLLKEVEGITVVRFGAEDVVRHALVARIVAAYEAENPPRVDTDRPEDTGP